MSDVSNYQPVLANFDSAGNLLQMWGPNGKVAFDPSNVAITGGAIPETLGVKLRRLARVAEVSNPLINPAWTALAAWAPSTAYTAGQVVTNGGLCFVCVTTGTSAASGGPTIVTNGDSHADGTTAWTYYEGPVAPSSDPSAPTVTFGTATPSGLTNFFQAATYPSLYLPRGGYPTTLAALYWRMYTFASASGANVSGSCAVDFEVVDSKFGIGLGNGTAPVRVIIERRDYAVGGLILATGATPNYATFDFSATSGWKRRRVRVESSKGGSGFDFCGVRVTPNGAVYAPSSNDDVRAVFISDSIMAGSSYGPMLPGNTVPGRVGKLLGWNDCWNFSQGGTGYIATNGGTSYTYGQRIPEALTRNPDVWVFMGSTNDNGQSAADIQAAALSAFQAIRAGGSRAPIIVLGVWPLNNANVPATEAAVQAAVSQFSDPLSRTFFIPVYADPTLPWVTGAWNNTANTSSTNAAMYIAGDGTHPADIGTAYLSHRIATAIKTNVLPSRALDFIS